MASNAENVSIWWRHHGLSLPTPPATTVTSQFLHEEEMEPVTFFHSIHNIILQQQNPVNPYMDYVNRFLRDKLIS